MKLLCRSWTRLASLHTYLSSLHPSSSSVSSFSLAAVVLLLLLPKYLGLLSAVMNQLPTFGVNHRLPRSEFIHQLEAHSAIQLKSLHERLFDDANKANLIPSELHGLPLVSRRDTAIRPASKVLSEDIWTITTCITNKTVLPRTLIKNRKRSKQFLIDAHRSLPAPVNTANTSHVHSSLDETSKSGNQLSQVHPATVQESQSFIDSRQTLTFQTPLYPEK